MTQAEAGTAYYEGARRGRLGLDAPGRINPDSAKTRWMRFEKGEIRDVPLNLPRMSAAVRGTVELAEAIINGAFNIDSTSVFRKVLDHNQSPKEKETLEEKQNRLKEEATVAAEQQFFELSEFLINGVDCGNSLSFLLGQREKRTRRSMQNCAVTSESELAFEYRRNQIVESFFQDQIYIDEDTKITALQDLWLTVYADGEKGLELLMQIERLYSGIKYRSKGAGGYLRKYAAHLATLLICSLNEGHFGLPSGISTIERLIESIPHAKQSTLKAKFAEVIYTFDSFPETHLVRNFGEEEKRYFENSVLQSIEEIAALEKELSETIRSLERGFKGYALFRLYDKCSANEFLENLWLIQDTFELYRLIHGKVHPGKEVSYHLSKSNDNFS